MFAAALDWLSSAPLWQAALALLAQNLVVFFFALAFGGLVERHRSGPALGEPAPPVTSLERQLAVATIGVNTAVTIAGLLLWRRGLIVVVEGGVLRSAFDCALLLVVMDAAMYWLHRMAHQRLLYGLLHEVHHRYDRPRPLTLFVLHPLETLGFGSLWLAVLLVYSPSWAGMSAYLVLNVAFGTVGHLKVEVLPAWFGRVPLLRLVAGGRFHVEHHQALSGNFGFYTSLWDALFASSVKRAPSAATERR